MKQERINLIKRISATMDSSKRAMQAQFYRSIVQTGIGPSHAHLLLLIQKEQPIQLKDLACKMFLTPGAITQTIESLFKDGYLTRKQDEHDRRSIFVTLTDKGIATVITLQETMQKHLTEMLATLSDAELQLYLKAQQKMLEYLEGEMPQIKQGGEQQC